MTYTANIKWLSFKQNLSDLTSVSYDEKATYAIMKYAHDIPQSLYCSTMEYLISIKEALYYRKLINLVSEYEAASKTHMVMDEEFVETIEVPINQNW